MGYKKYKEEQRRFNSYTENSVRCPCCHSVLIPYYVEKAICTWCGKYVFKTKELEFKYKMKEALGKQK